MVSFSYQYRKLFCKFQSQIPDFLLNYKCVELILKSLFTFYLQSNCTTMLRSCLNATAQVSKIPSYSICSVRRIPDAALPFCRSYSILSSNAKCLANNTLFQTKDLNITPVRTKMNIRDNAIEHHRVYPHDRRTGKRTSCEAAATRFFRLRWGGWIRTIREKPSDNIRFRNHVFCNAQQSRLLDKLTGAWYMRPHYYVDDPYEPYHTREEFLYTRKKPVPARD